MNSVKQSLEELLAHTVSDQEAFFECSTNKEGVFTDPDDRREYERVEAMITRGRNALGISSQEEI